MTQCAAMVTPPFPQNGPGLKPTFNGVELVLMGRATPPEQLLKHISCLDKEFDAAGKSPAPADSPASPELEALLTPEALFQWNYPLFRLVEVRFSRARARAHSPLPPYTPTSSRALLPSSEPAPPQILPIYRARRCLPLIVHAPP